MPRPKRFNNSIEAALLEATAMVEQSLRRVLNNPSFRVMFGRQDQLRLLNLLTWSERYRVSVDDILLILVSFWQDKFPSRRPVKGRLGVSISTLLGKRSREILETRLLRMYPNYENVAAWRSSQKMRVLQKSFIMTEVKDPFVFVEQYKTNIARTRHASDVAQIRKTRRKYRGNPFV